MYKNDQHFMNTNTHNPHRNSGIIRTNNFNPKPSQNHSLQQHIHEVLNSKPHKTSTLNHKHHGDNQFNHNYDSLKAN